MYYNRFSLKELNTEKVQKLAFAVLLFGSSIKTKKHLYFLIQVNILKSNLQRAHVILNLWPTKTNINQSNLNLIYFLKQNKVKGQNEMQIPTK